MVKKKTILDFQEMKKRGEKVTWLTSYDYPTAMFAERACMDMKKNKIPFTPKHYAIICFPPDMIQGGKNEIRLA